MQHASHVILQPQLAGFWYSHMIFRYGLGLLRCFHIIAFKNNFIKTLSIIKIYNRQNNEYTHIWSSCDESGKSVTQCFARYQLNTNPIIVQALLCLDRHSLLTLSPRRRRNITHSLEKRTILRFGNKITVRFFKKQ